MEQQISPRDFQSIINVAKACDPIFKKREKAQEAIRKASKELRRVTHEWQIYEEQITLYEQGVVENTGYHVTDLVKKVVEPSVDSLGKEHKSTKFIPTDKVRYDQYLGKYIINTPEKEQQSTIEPIELESL